MLVEEIMRGRLVKFDSDKKKRKIEKIQGKVTACKASRTLG